MWSVIYLFCGYMSANSDASLQRIKRNLAPDIHKDGGKYHVRAWDGDKADISGLYDDSGWEKFHGASVISNNRNVFWLGVYNFADDYPEIFAAEKTTQQSLHKLYCATLEKDFKHGSLNADEREKLAEAAKSGLILKDGDSYKPNFVIFTREQLDKLYNEVFAPFLPEVDPIILGWVEYFAKLHKADFPQVKQNLIEHHVGTDVGSCGMFIFISAAENNRLFLPKTPEAGVPLTLVLVK